MSISEKFVSIFKVEMNEGNVSRLMKLPVKKSGDIASGLHNWKKYQHKPSNDLENRALTLIYLKTYQYIKEPV